LAALVGIVKWVQDNNIPVDLSFLESYTPAFFASAPATTPRTSVSETRTWQTHPDPWSVITHTRTVTSKGCELLQ